MLELYKKRTNKTEYVKMSEAFRKKASLILTY